MSEYPRGNYVALMLQVLFYVARTIEIVLPLLIMPLEGYFLGDVCCL